MTTSRPSRSEPWPTPSSARMPSFRIGSVEHFDLDAELASSARAAGEFSGIQNVRRLVDEIAGKQDAIANTLGGGPCLARGSDILNRDPDIGSRCRFFLVVVLLFRLVAVEFIGAELEPQRQLGRVGPGNLPPGVCATTVTLRADTGSLATIDPPSFSQSVALSSLAFPSQNQQPVEFQARRRGQLDALPRLPLNFSALATRSNRSPEGRKAAFAAAPSP